MLLSVSNEGDPDHHLFYGNLSGTGAVAQLWVASLMSQKKKKKTGLKTQCTEKNLQCPNKINNTA